MEDRHARQIAEAIKSAGTAIAFAIWMGAMWVGCTLQMASSLHH